MSMIAFSWNGPNDWVSVTSSFLTITTIYAAFYGSKNFVIESILEDMKHMIDKIPQKTIPKNITQEKSSLSLIASKLKECRKKLDDFESNLNTISFRYAFANGFFTLVLIFVLYFDASNDIGKFLIISLLPILFHLIHMWYRRYKNPVRKILIAVEEVLSVETSESENNSSLQALSNSFKDTVTDCLNNHAHRK